jgi:arginyl-tRNA synthetase
MKFDSIVEQNIIMKLNKMENISSFILRHLLEAAQKLPYYDQIPTKMWRIVTYNKNGSDYAFCGLIGIGKKVKKDIVDVYSDITQRMTLDVNLINYEYTDKKILFYVTEHFIVSHAQRAMLVDRLILPAPQKKKIAVDFSSPNIAKDMHVGHLRSTIIGDSVCRVLELLGHDVDRINHLGDFGLQFGMLIQHFHENFNQDESDLQKFYEEAKQRFDDDEDFKRESYNRVVELQKGNESVVNDWMTIVDVSKKAYQEIYDRLGIKITDIGESFYQHMIPGIVAELKYSGLAVEDEGRYIIEHPKKEVPLTVTKSDGGYTYDTTDLAALKYRLVDCGYDEVYYVVDRGQGDHFEQVFDAGRRAGWLKDQKVEHIGFGLVLGDDGKRFRSRDGGTVKLVDLLDKAVVKATESVQIKDTDMSEAQKEQTIRSLAYSAIKYTDLSKTRTNNYKFSYDEMLSHKGNTAVYLLYAAVRIGAIFRKAGDRIMSEAYGQVNQFTLTEQFEFDLAKYLLQFPEVIETVANTFHFHHLCNYLYELSNIFSRFFTSCRCLEFDDNGEEIISADYNRLLLCELTMKVMWKGFNLLNIEPVEKM